MNEQNRVPNITKVPPVNLRAAMPLCPECGMFHPPLRQGESCPNKPAVNKDGKVIPFESFFSKLKIICKSQIDKKNVKDPEKLLNKVILVVTKELEKFKEK